MSSKVPITNRHGDVVAHAVVDDEDLPLVADKRWHLDQGYAQHSFWDADEQRTRRVKMHRLVLGFNPGDPQVDHRDLDRLNNQKSNLRPATVAQNKQNGRKYQRRDMSRPPMASKHRGVHYRNDRGLWVATATVGGKSHYIGSSRDEDEAGRMAADWRRENMPHSEMDQAS